MKIQPHINDGDPLLPGFEMVAPFQKHTEQGKSNTVELFDALVTYSLEHSRDVPKFIEVEKRVRNGVFNVRIAPAAIKKDGKLVNILPGKRESLVEKALRKIAASDRNALKVEPEANGNTGVGVYVQTTMYQIRSLLAEQGHGYKISEIHEALSVLSGCKMTIEGSVSPSDMGRENTLIADFEYERKSKGDDSGREYTVRVKLHPYITHSILQKTFRQIDFNKLMRPKNELARWIYTRMSHHYTQASEDDLVRHVRGDKNAGYHLALTTIIRETGIPYTGMKAALRATRTALTSLREHGVLIPTNQWTDQDFQGWIEEIRYGPSTGGRKPILDVIITMFPSSSVCDDIINANRTAVALRAHSAGGRRL